MFYIWKKYSNNVDSATLMGITSPNSTLYHPHPLYNSVSIYNARSNPTSKARSELIIDQSRTNPTELISELDCARIGHPVCTISPVHLLLHEKKSNYP